VLLVEDRLAFVIEPLALARDEVRKTAVFAAPDPKPRSPDTADRADVNCLVRPFAPVTAKPGKLSSA